MSANEIPIFIPNNMQLTITSVIEILGTVAFTVSGVYSALEKRLDILGVTIIGFVPL